MKPIRGGEKIFSDLFLNQTLPLFPITLNKVGSQGPEKGRIAHIIDKNIGNTSIAKEGLIDREPHENGV